MSHDLSEKSDDQARVDRCTFGIHVPIFLSSRCRYRKLSRSLVIIPLRRENNAQNNEKPKGDSQLPWKPYITTSQAMPGYS